MELHLRGHDRVKLGRMLNPVRGFIDIGAASLALIGIVALIIAGAGNLSRQLALLVYGLTIVALYTVSSLYHSIPWRERWKHRMQRLDHAMIYVLIAGSYTPIAVVVLSGWLRVVTLAAIWGITAFGVIQKFALPRIRTWFAVTLTTTQGWLALLLLIPLSQLLPWPAIALTLSGGALYTIGMIFLVTQRPQLWPRVFSYHEAMHVFVVGGSLLHWIMTMRYIAPYPA